MKALLGAFNQRKALVGAFSEIVKLRQPSFQALLVTCRDPCRGAAGKMVAAQPDLCGDGDKAGAGEAGAMKIHTTTSKLSRIL